MFLHKPFNLWWAIVKGRERNDRGSFAAAPTKGDCSVDLDQQLARAQDCLNEGQLDEALAAYSAVLTAQANHSNAHYGVGIIYAQQGRTAEAREHLVKAVQNAPGVPAYLYNLARVEMHLGNLQDAGAAFIQAAVTCQGDINYLLPICQHLLQLGQPQQAYAYLESSGDKSPNVSFWKARAQGAMGDWEGAIKVLQALLHEFPDDATIWREHSVAAAQLRDDDTAIDSFLTYMEKAEAKGEDHLVLADLYTGAGRPREALAALEKSFALGVDRAEAYLVAGKCARLEGDYDALKRNLEKALDQQPTYGPAWQFVFEVAETDEYPEIAQRCLSLAGDERCTEWDRPLLLLTGARALEKLGRFAEAFEIFNEGNQSHKDLLARQNLVYSKEAFEVETATTIGRYPVGHAFPSASDGADQRPLFIVGMPRSGTTLLEKILSCLDGVEAGGENEALEYVALQYNGDLAQMQAAYPEALPRDALDAMAAEYWRRTPNSAPVVTDKMPHNFRHVGLAAQLFPEVPIIYMKRDPRDVCLSIYSRMFPDAHSYAVDLDWLAHLYAQSERLKSHWLAAFPGRVIEVVYEDLVQDLEGQTKAIADFCGLDWNPGCLAFHTKAGTSFTYSELQVRKPLNKDGIGRWRHYEQQLAPLTEALGRYGVL